MPMGPINGKPPHEPELDNEEPEEEFIPEEETEEVSEVHHVERVSVGEGASHFKNAIILGICLMGILIVLVKFLTYSPPADY